MFEEFEWRQYLLELHEAVAIYFSLYRLKVQYMLFLPHNLNATFSHSPVG